MNATQGSRQPGRREAAQPPAGIQQRVTGSVGHCLADQRTKPVEHTGPDLAPADLPPGFNDRSANWFAAAGVTAMFLFIGVALDWRWAAGIAVLWSLCCIVGRYTGPPRR